MADFAERFEGGDDETAEGESELKKGGDRLPHVDEDDIANNIRNKKDMTEVDHDWLADYHTRKAKLIRGTKNPIDDPYADLEN